MRWRACRLSCYGFRMFWMEMIAAVARQPIGSARLPAEKLRLYQRIEHDLAGCPLDATQTLRLFGCEPQPWHSQEI